MDTENGVRRDDLLAYWPFDDGGGAETTEAVSGSAFCVRDAPGRRTEAPSGPRRVDGVSNAALLFDGYSTWVEAPIGGVADSLSALTVGAWVAPRSFVGGVSVGDADRLAAVVSRHDADDGRGFEFGVSEHGTWGLGVGLGDAWTEVRAEAAEVRLPTGEWSHVVGTFDGSAGRLTLYLNGERAVDASVSAGEYIRPADEPLRIGKNSHPTTVDETFDVELFDGVIDELSLFDSALTDAEVAARYERALEANGGDHPEADREDIALDRDRYDADPDRPQYHVRPPGHWMNEPHAPIYVDGQYHLFYQHNPAGPYFHNLHWGHWVSDDMVHWRSLPVALAPERGAVNPDGAWSGSATVDTDGSPALLFTAGNEQRTPNQSIGLARPATAPAEDPDYTEWSKLDEPVIEKPHGVGLRENDFRDPHVWQEGDEWFCLVGAGVDDGSGTALVYRTETLEQWDFRGQLYRNDRDEYPELGHVWELPVLLPLGTDSDGDEKHVFIVSPEGRGADVEVYYWIGEWDSEQCTFTPDDEEPQLIDYGDFHFTGPSGMVDPKTGRSILFTIAQDLRSARERYETGYAHNGGLPVELSLRDDDRLAVDPIDELQSLRGEHLVSATDQSVDAVNERLAGVGGETLEIALRFDADEGNVGDGTHSDGSTGTGGDGGTDDDPSTYGLAFRQSPGGSEETVVEYDGGTGEIALHREQSTLDPATRAQMARRSRLIHRGELDLDGEPLDLHVYLDRSMVECYANSLRSITTRVYPTRDDAIGLEVRADGDAMVASLDVWKIEGY